MVKIPGQIQDFMKGGGGGGRGRSWVVSWYEFLESGGPSRRIPGHIREFNWLEPHLGNEMVFKTWQN